MLAVEPLAHGTPVGEGGARIGRRHRPDLGVERRDPAPPVGQPGAVGRRAVARRPVERVGHPGQRSLAPHRAEQDRGPDDDEDDRPELAPADRRQVEPERPLAEEPDPDAQDEQPDDERPDPTAVATIAATMPPRRRGRRRGARTRAPPAARAAGGAERRLGVGGGGAPHPLARPSTGSGRGWSGSGSGHPWRSLVADRRRSLQAIRAIVVPSA